MAMFAIQEQHTPQPAQERVLGPQLALEPPPVAWSASWTRPPSAVNLEVASAMPEPNAAVVFRPLMAAQRRF